jgi:hypothetical protein
MYSEDNGVNWKSFNPDYFMDPGGTLPNVNAVEIKGDSVYAGYEDFGVWVSVLPTMTGIGEYPDGLNESYLKTYPNPFTTSTTIEYYLDQPETVTIAFYNQFGKQVDKIEQKQSSGIQQVVWTPENLANGIYYFSVQAGRKLASDKVLLMK